MLDKDRKNFLKGHLLFRIFGFFSAFLVVYFVFSAPHARAAQSEDDFLRHLVPSLNLEVTEGTGQTENGAISRDNIDNAFFKVLPSPDRVRVPLSNRLKLFFDLHSTLRDIYEKYNNNNKKCATLGIDFSF